MNRSRHPSQRWLALLIPALAVILGVGLLFALRLENRRPEAPALPTQRSLPTTIIATPALAAAQAIPKNTATLLPDAGAENVALIGEAALTWRVLSEALTIDGVMAALTGQAPATPAAVLEQLINTEVVLQRAGSAGDAAGARALLDDLLARHGTDYTRLGTALQQAGVASAAFDAYFARLVAADAYLRAQQAAAGRTPAALIGEWQRTAHISFGPLANSILGAVQTTAATLTATPAALALADPTAVPAEETVAPVEAPITVELASTEPVVDSQASDSNEPRGVEVGQIAPEFSLPQFTEGSEPKTLRNLLDAPSVLIFWTTWCPYCLRQTPALVEADRQWREQGIQFVGINVKEDAGTVAPYVQQNGIEYPVLLDAEGVTAAAYAVQGYPTTYFLDGDNRIVARHVGALTEDELNSYLLMLRPR